MTETFLQNEPKRFQSTGGDCILTMFRINFLFRSTSRLSKANTDRISTSQKCRDRHQGGIYRKRECDREFIFWDGNYGKNMCWLVWIVSAVYTRTQIHRAFWSRGNVHLAQVDFTLIRPWDGERFIINLPFHSRMRSTTKWSKMTWNTSSQASRKDWRKDPNQVRSEEHC